ncbi:hypothetical protein GCM10022243_48030 [Saccharothrix violaceirubra]|uniref:Rv2525c-like glycoside hydrolase-like domain-containing protein n=1 Tax=Saccharothrix violaceirubra TaxID=413306 RepID=A0A7W7T1Y7_9PSEU|nr:DUF1906 domain-containing protein [Saccharothrix violaceirubra]MBB4963855.1 hypothetical protein [Saccharothrix violaceirubra]
MAQVLDYSAGIPGGAAIKAAGYAGAVRYIGLPGYTKSTTRSELDDFTAHGLGMALVFEHLASDWRGGYLAGSENYRRARQHATAIGFPADRPIYMAVDQDVVTNAEFGVALAYIRGARDAAGGDPGLVGVYGEYDVCAAVAAWRGPTGDRLCDWYWQCRAWSGTPVRLLDARHLYQRVGTVTVGGVDCDINDVLQDDWGQHLEDSVGVNDSLGEVTVGGNTFSLTLAKAVKELYLGAYEGGGDAGRLPAYIAANTAAAAWDTPLDNRYGGQVTAKTMLAYIDQHVNDVRAEQAAQREILAQLAQHPDITPERLEQVVRDAVQAANTAHLAEVTAVVREIVGARDENLADEVVDEIGRRTARAA